MSRYEVKDPHTEGYICGAQELAVMTKFHEKRILKNGDDDVCRLCKKDPETILHILGACDVLAKREYLTRHILPAKLVVFV